MKTTLNLRTASVAIAASLASTTAVQAKESAADVSYVPELDVVIAAEDPDRPTVAGAQISALDQGNITIPGMFAPIEMNIPQLADPIVLEPMVQQAIYDVDFVGDTDGGFVTVSADTPISAPSTANIPLINAPTTIEGDAQQAIFDVEFSLDGVVAVQGPLVDLQDGPLVTARGVQTYNLHANYGDIDAFYGDIVAFYGDIDAFWGDINPFYGDIGAFWGDIDAFWGNINPFYGDITAFWGDIDAFWGDIVAFDAGNLQSLGNYGQTLSTRINNINVATAQGSYSTVGMNLNQMRLEAVEQFGANGFTSADADAIFARHGIVFGNATTYLMSDAQRAAFFLDWHDTVNTYSGIDAVDHWMTTINWTPAITQIQGDGADTLIGIIDSNIKRGDLADNVASFAYFADGLNTDLNGHGVGVASLIAGAHDGQGVMGISPNANLYHFNPFDADGQTTWARVTTAIRYAGNYNRFNTALGAQQEVSVINLSLGEAGWVASQGLADVLADPSITAITDDTVFVIAAGNDGIAQTADINWGYSDGANGRESDSHAIFVGSVRPDGSISNFSNRPGDACLLDNGVCNTGNELMNRFIVAPGELLLVSDGNGGVTRVSGTSFAAPLVSGAIALLHDRWPWLQNHAKATTDIIFQSARDLGAPGVDAVYGHGLLDVVASQSPLDFNAMTYGYFVKKGPNWKTWGGKTGANILWDYTPSYWETNQVFLTAIESVGDTHRDFLIPASSFHYGKDNNSLGNGYQRMQDFVGDRFARWVQSDGADKDGDGKAGVSQIQTGSREMRNEWHVEIAAIQPHVSEDGTYTPVHNAATLTDPSGKLALTFGHGQGAMALSADSFGVISDYDPYSGGVNPVLGLASGELFGQASYNVLPNTRVSLGFSANNEDWTELNTRDPRELAARQAIGAREASALSVSIEQKVTDAVTVNAQWTRLNEDDAMFGAQASALTNGTGTDALTLSASVNLGNGFSFDLSATGAKSETNGDQVLRSNGAIISTAAQMAVTKRGIANDRDKLRVSFGQPLTVEQGELEFTMLGVVDRQTGELGPITQSFGIETKRRVNGEIVYATQITDNSDFGLFGRYVSEGGQDQEENFMIGANFGLRF